MPSCKVFPKCRSKPWLCHTKRWPPTICSPRRPSSWSPDFALKLEMTEQWNTTIDHHCIEVNENCLLRICLTEAQLMTPSSRKLFHVRIPLYPWRLASHSYADPWDVWRLPRFRNRANVPLLPNGRWLIGMQHQEYHKQLLSPGRCQCVAPAAGFGAGR